MNLRNHSSYIWHLFRFFLILTVGLSIVFIIREHRYSVFAAIFVLVLMIIFISNPFYECIEIKGCQVTITIRKWLMKVQSRLVISETNISIEEFQSFRGGREFQLIFCYQGQRIKITDKDGFQQSQLLSLKDFFDKEKKRCVVA